MWESGGQVGQLGAGAQAHAKDASVLGQISEYPLQLKMQTRMNRRELSLLLFVAGGLLVEDGLELILVHVGSMEATTLRRATANPLLPISGQGRCQD